MENSLKQRIVGAIVLVALAVIFLPLILKEKTKTESFQSQIPEKPIALVEHRVPDEVKKQNQAVRNELDEVESNVRKRKTKAAEVPQTTEADAGEVSKIAPINDKTEPVVKEKSKPEVKNSAGSIASKKTSINSNFKGAAWLMQVASFSNLDNANKMVTKLKKSKFKAYRRSVKNQAGKTIHRIYVGPYIEKSKAAKDLTKVSKISQSKALLLVFDPKKH